jgi:hypothetical protein
MLSRALHDALRALGRPLSVTLTTTLIDQFTDYIAANAK